MWPTRRREWLKLLHWSSLFLLLYFFFVEPDENRADPGAALSTHSGVGLVLAIVVLAWFVLYLRVGLSGRPGPKLPPWMKKLHRLSHLALTFALPVTILTGALAGLAAPFTIRAFGALPINPGFGAKGIHEAMQEIHEIAFDLLIILVVLHAAFHVWRHFGLKDNALRIMVPVRLHRYL